MKVKKLFLIDDVKEYKYSFLKSPILQANGSEYQVPFPVIPTEGTHTLESCGNCRSNWQRIYDNSLEKYKTFPNCCEYHKNLVKKSFFDKDDFNDVPKMIANKVMYSYHHIINFIDSKNWYQEIVDYLNYIRESFGSMPKNCGNPLMLDNYYDFLFELLQKTENESSEKITKVEAKTRMNKIKELIDFRRNPPKINDNSTDINLLLSKYDEWYKTFPFDLPYFKHLEDEFRRKIPLSRESHYNKYLQLTEYKAHTKNSLSAYLLQITQTILSSINGMTLYEQGILNSTDQIQIDLIIQNRKLELLELSKMPNTNKQEYIKVLKKWFKQEKKFINEITPLLKHRPKPLANQRPNRTDIAYYCYYCKETKTLKTNNPFPSDKAWKEIGKEFSKTWKNIQQAYNLICNDENERLKKSKKGNLEYIIKEMLHDNEKAKKLAEKELNTLILNS